jgi:hypothetical protein
MRRTDAEEAAPIVDRMLTNLIATVPASGRTGLQARTTISDTRVNAFKFCIENGLGPPLDSCFDLARQAGASMQRIDQVRIGLEQETPATLGGKIVQNAGIRLCLATEARMIADTDFVSRQDVDAIKKQMFQPFADAQEIAADDMDQVMFQALIKLNGTMVAHLVATARPLPRMVNFQFFSGLPSLVISYKLYDDASRCDELREENKVVHPAFCPMIGKALSA